jgi:hypothetical protein
VPTMLAMLYPNVAPEVLENILFTARILDKLGRIAQDPLGAGEDAYLDTAGYAMLGANGQRLKREAKPKEAAPTVSVVPAAELCLRRREGSPHVVQTGSIIERPHTSHRVSGDGWVVCRNGRYLNCHENAWVLFPDWGTQFPTKVGAEYAARQIDPETGKIGGNLAILVAANAPKAEPPSEAPSCG